MLRGIEPKEIKENLNQIIKSENKMEYIYYLDNEQVKEEQEVKLLKVYNNHNEEIDGKIVAFWIKENALANYEEEFLQSRINDVVYVCLDSSNDEIVGVCSGNSVYFEQLRNHFFYLRIFVAERTNEDRVNGKNCIAEQSN